MKPYHKGFYYKNVKWPQPNYPNDFKTQYFDYDIPSGIYSKDKKKCKNILGSHIVGGSVGIVILKVLWVYCGIKQMSNNVSVFVNQNFWCRIKRYRFMMDEVK